MSQQYDLEIQNERLKTVYGLSPHTCKYCEKLTIGITDKPDSSYSFTYEEIFEGSEHGCTLFQRWKLLDGWERSENCSLIVEFNKYTKRVYIYMLKNGMKEHKEGLVVSALHDTAPANYINARPCILKPSSTESISNMRSWLQECRQTHSNCQKLASQMSSTASPGRLLSIGENVDDPVKLHVVATNEAVEFASLSYCWGDNQSHGIICLQKNVVELEGGIDLNKLSKSIQEAVWLTRQLGILFLWVDALCIIQDDPEDMQREIRKMGNIYAKATLVISASTAENAAQGFLQDHDTLGEFWKIRFSIRGSSTQSFALLHEKEYLNHEQEAIDTRAWTMQEHALASRLLRFGLHQVEWRCAGAFKVDGGSTKNSENTNYTRSYDDVMIRFLTGIGADLKEKRDVFFRWNQTATEFINRKISYQSDRLPAISAMASRLAEMTNLDPSSYILGLWREDIPASLLWHSRLYYAGNKWKNENYFSLGDSRIPSWTWISSPGPVSISGHDFGNRTFHTRTVQCEVKLRDEKNPFGKVQSAALVVEGLLREAMWNGSKLCFHGVSKDEISLGEIFNDWDYYKKPETPTKVWLLTIQEENWEKPDTKSTLKGLILERVASKTYKRIGLWTIYNSLKWDSFKVEGGWKEELQTLRLL